MQFFFFFKPLTFFFLFNSYVSVIKVKATLSKPAPATSTIVHSLLWLTTGAANFPWPLLDKPGPTFLLGLCRYSFELVKFEYQWWGGGEGGVVFISRCWYSWTSDERHTRVAWSDHLFWNHVLLSVNWSWTRPFFATTFVWLLTKTDSAVLGRKVVATFDLKTLCLSYCLGCAPSSASILLRLLG